VTPTRAPGRHSRDEDLHRILNGDGALVVLGSVCQADAVVLPDYLAPDLAVVFVGTSVGTESASCGHYYSGPGNRFWELLWEAGLTGNRRLVPDQDARVLKYSIGLTDIVKGRASSSDALLQRLDFDVPGFLAKIQKYKPFVVAFNGKEAAKAGSCARPAEHQEPRHLRPRYRRSIAVAPSAGQKAASWRVALSAVLSRWHAPVGR